MQKSSRLAGTTGIIINILCGGLEVWKKICLAAAAISGFHPYCGMVRRGDYQCFDNLLVATLKNCLFARSLRHRKMKNAHICLIYCAF